MSYVRLTCIGTSFTPWLKLASGSTATVTWTIEGGSLSAPVTPTISTAASGGTVVDGAYQIEITYTDGNGETLPSTSTSVIASSGGANTNTIIITSPATSGSAIGWYAYVTQVGGSSYTRQQTAGSPTAIGTNLVLTTPPTSTGATPPSSNSSGQATGLTPTITLPGGTSYIDLSAASSGASALDQISMFNVGYDDSIDTGNYNIGPSYNWSSQQMTGIEYLNLMTGLTIFAADQTPLSGALDFTGMAALTHIEVYATKVTGVTLTGCTAIERLQVEQCQLTTLDINPVSSCLYDLRAANQGGGTLTFATLTSPMAREYHFCVRDQVILNPPTPAQLPVVQQEWIWDTDLEGEYAPTSTVLTSIMAYDNFFTSANLSSVPAGAGIELNGNNLRSIILGGPTNQGIDLSYNCFDTPNVDAILATVDGWNVTNGTLNIQGNQAPSPTGQAHITSLQSNGWTVTFETDATAARPAGVVGDSFNRPDATGIASVGNGWFTTGSANANISSNTLVRTDSGSYQQFLNMGSGTLPPDYTVYARFPGSNMGNTYFGLIGRYTKETTSGVQVFFDSGWAVANLVICNSRGYETRPVTYTNLTAFPATWTDTAIDHIMAMRMSGTTITVFLDGVAVAQATVPDNASVWGTGYGISGEGDNRTYYAIGATGLVNGSGSPQTII